MILLNRVIRWVDGVGLEVEADPRQAERLVAQLGLTGSNAVSTPGVKVSTQELEADEVIQDSRGKVFQAGSARSNYMGPDRPDIMFGTKECCRRMSQPTEVAMRALKRVGRFIEGHPRLVLSMRFEEPQPIDVYVDSDYAGCPRTRKSTSGGCIMMGTHLIKSWSSTQNNAISLSSGEAELYSIVKGVGTGLGVQQFLEDFGVSAAMRVHTDSAAAQGICKRVGLGTQRHIAVNSLWVQEKLRKKEFTLFKIRGEDNPADLMTKHLPSDKMIKCLGFMGATFREGRAAIAPLRKEHERLTGEDLDWQLAETARNELDNSEVEMRLMVELGSSVEHTELNREEIMSTGECSGRVTGAACGHDADSADGGYARPTSSTPSSLVRRWSEAP